jgi:aminoglycoside 6-adenylyltransferase
LTGGGSRVWSGGEDVRRDGRGFLHELGDLLGADAVPGGCEASRVFPDEGEVLARLLAWAEQQDAIRALVLTSSRARQDDTVDLLSDYDVIVAVRDVGPFAAGYGWETAIGLPLARWGDESTLLDETTVFRGVVYDDGVKVDYTFWPEALLDRVAEAPELPDCLDVGYRVVLDKDERTSGWARPTYRAHIPSPPTRDEYRAQVEEFWWAMTYAAKALWRGEVVFAKFVIDYDTKLGPLRRFLEWRIEIEHGWSVRPGVFGRGLERLLPPDLAAELLETYVGADVDESWDALARTTALFRRVAREVGDALGYEYPQAVDEGVTAHVETVRALASG